VAGKLQFHGPLEAPFLSPLNFILWGDVKNSKRDPFERKIEKATEISYRVYGKEWNTEW